MEDYQLDNYNLLRLDVKIKSLNKKLSELYKAKNDIINKRTYNVGDCFTHDIYYYKILKINSNNTYKVICVNFSIDDVGISLINDMSVKALNNLFILSKKSFDNTYALAKNYLHINSNTTKINE